jgi:hypothetical protein
MRYYAILIQVYLFLGREIKELIQSMAILCAAKNEFFDWFSTIEQS